ncbi:MAG TPA: glycoside hydrolase family 15 protein [Candidatus Dormibacteraeota bacterium]|nr:glycoside hydrolase family 15 protein [Candidatus Dormibacteraeota bacterium]
MSEWTADVAPTANVVGDHWTPGNKDAIGTANSRQSNVWFTAVHGTLADLLYPTVDVDNLRQLDYLVTDGSSFFFDAAVQGDATSRVTDDRALTYQLTVEDKQHHFSLITDIATDPERPVVVLQGHVSGGANLMVYGYLVPHIVGTGSGQIAFFDGSRAYVHKKDVWLAIGGDIGTDTAGYLGHGDGYDQLHQDRLTSRFRQAGPGRVTLTWRLNASGSDWSSYLAFGPSRAAADAALGAALKRGAAGIIAAYRDGWRQYAAQLTPYSGATTSFYHNAEVIKMAEDKLHPGAIVASLAQPWGDTAPDDNSDVGYRKVWPRDLYHAASGLLAAGDTTTAYDVLRFMGKQQQADGSMPQNTDLEGKPVWPGQQLDETADAILLAVRLAGRATGPDIERAAGYLIANGPATQQERWEEASGYSPATIATEVAALRAGARMVNPDHAAKMRETAARWDTELESETFTHTGPYGSGYYIRISPDGKPDTAEPINIANGGGVWDQREIVDPSYLELVRLGVRAANDPRIVATIAVVDGHDSTAVGGNPMWYRYPHDGYGERNAGSAPPGVGHPWPLLSLERGVYDVIEGRRLTQPPIATSPDDLIGEQVWEDGGDPTGSARPLVWAHAEAIILGKAIATGVVDDRPT